MTIPIPIPKRSKGVRGDFLDFEMDITLILISTLNAHITVKF